MEFTTWGPFETSTSGKQFWAAVDDQCEEYNYERYELRNAIGCYVFVTKYGSKYTPWYVGKAGGKQGFHQEVLTPHKRGHYKQALEQSKRPSGYLILFPLMTPSGRFSRASESRSSAIENLERMLIGMALAKNPTLRNTRDTKMLRSVYVEGVFGKQDRGRPSPSAGAAKSALT